MQAALQFAGSAVPDAASAAKKTTPPPVAGAPPAEATASVPPAAASEVFSGVSDEESYGAAPMAAPSKVEPPQAHTMSQHVPLDMFKPTYRQANIENGWGQHGGESDDDFRKRLKSAAGSYGDTIHYSEDGAYTKEKELSSRQRAWWNGLTSEDRETPVNEQKLAAMKIGLNEGHMPLAHTTRVQDLESPAGRMETLNRLSQNMDPNDPNRAKTDEVSCAGASIVGGVLLAGGREGLSKLYNAVKSPDAENQTPEEKALQEKLAGKGELSLGELQQLQQMVYKKLKENEGMSPEAMQEQVKIATESKDPAARAEAKKKLMVGQKGMETFMKGNEEIAKMFADNGLDLVAIDTDDDTGNEGKGQANHICLRINGKDGEPIAYYDPWKKKGDQGQIINAQDENLKRNSHEVPPAVLDDYKKAERVRGHYDQSKSAREYTSKLTAKYGRPDDDQHLWWTDEQEKEVRKLDGQG
jgi:hypothetical protein